MRTLARPRIVTDDDSDMLPAPRKPPAPQQTAAPARVPTAPPPVPPAAAPPVAPPTAPPPAPPAQESPPQAEPEPTTTVQPKDIVDAARLTSQQRVRTRGTDYGVVWTELFSQLFSRLIGPVTRLFVTMYNRAGSEDRFAQELHEIADWSDSKVAKIASRFVQAEPDAPVYFELAYGAKVLLINTAVRRESEAPVEIPVPEFKDFVHHVLVQCASTLLPFPGLIDPRLQHVEKARARRTLRKFFHDAMADAIGWMVPIDQITSRSADAKKRISSALAAVPDEEEENDDAAPRAGRRFADEEEEEEDEPEKSESEEGEVEEDDRSVFGNDASSDEEPRGVRRPAKPQSREHRVPITRPEDVAERYANRRPRADRDFDDEVSDNSE